MGAIGVAVAIGLVAVLGLYMSTATTSELHATGSGQLPPRPSPEADGSPPSPLRPVACGAEAPAGAGKPKPQFAGPPPMKIDPNTTYTATMETSCGTIVIQLDPKTAPQTVNSFVFLANHQYFDGQYIHRIDTSIDVLQGGDPDRHRRRRPGLRDPRETARRRAVRSPACSPWPTRSQHRRQPVLHHHGRERPQPRLRPPTTRSSGRSSSGLDVARRSEASDRRPGGRRPGGYERSGAEGRVYIDSVTITEKP